MTLHAMRQANANLLLMPVVGMTKPGDFDHYTRVRCHKLIGHHYPPDSGEKTPVARSSRSQS